MRFVILFTGFVIAEAINQPLIEQFLKEPNDFFKLLILICIGMDIVEFFLKFFRD